MTESARAAERERVAFRKLAAQIVMDWSIEQNPIPSTAVTWPLVAAMENALTATATTARTAGKRESLEEAERIIALSNVATEVQDVVGEILEVSLNLVGLWTSPKITALPRSERNAAIDETRQRMIDLVRQFRQAMRAIRAKEG